ncbi:leucine-rich repeat domain, L domain-like protein [Artemisia annua]|uniref:Leucine-rich repeat domain, L domain-like protein n=1 Tax=Artemisia annua TaxID=35608 RepID=A0A2U1QDK3_ARTAN|nr:leucine-rich repeat domain, L domain-like protein [Artemisia annua]
MSSSRRRNIRRLGDEDGYRRCNTRAACMLMKGTKTRLKVNPDYRKNLKETILLVKYALCMLAPPTQKPKADPACSLETSMLHIRVPKDPKPFHRAKNYNDHLFIQWQGKANEFSRNLGLVKTIDLSTNSLTGQIPYEITNLQGLVILNLSNNALLGEIPKDIGQMKELQSLDLSKNSFSGGLPSSMSEMNFLDYLDVSHNKFSGRIPSSTQLQSFEPSRYIGNAGLCGPPLTKYCPGDKELEVAPVVGETKSDGEAIDELKRWFYIGGATGFVTAFGIVFGTFLLNRRARHAFSQCQDSLKDWMSAKVAMFLPGKREKAVELKSPVIKSARKKGEISTDNNDQKTLPEAKGDSTKITTPDIVEEQVNQNWNVRVVISLQCKAVTLLQSNKPKQLSSENDPLNPEAETPQYFTALTHKTTGISYIDHLFIQWKGKVNEFRNLGLVKTIDLSTNSLTGQIPYEITNLQGLVILNLSNNALLGEIPKDIGQLKELESLDLSKNSFSGGLPSSMSEMNFLNYLDVSHNNLSGRIPSSTQLQSFEPSRYIGNAGLCGPPLTKYCPRDKELEVTPVVGESKSDGEAIDELKRWFYIGGATGFVTAFGIVFGTLLLNRRARHAFSQCQDSLKDWMYAKVAMSMAKWRRVSRA